VTINLKPKIMAKVILILLLSLSFQFGFSNDRDEVLNRARELKESKNYNQAIKEYVSYVKLFKNEAVNLKDIYYEIANCYFLNKNNFMAFKVVKETISRYGATKEDLETSTILDKKLFEVAWADIFPEYTTLRKQFIKRLNNVDIYVENNTVELKTK
jgi:tetratricopeptide (TPR) repeat protein